MLLDFTLFFLPSDLTLSMFFFCRYGSTLSPVWQWHISVYPYLVLLHFSRWPCHLQCFCSVTVSPEFSSLRLHPLRGFPEMVAAALFLQGSRDESCWRLDIPHRCHDSVWCLWEPCNLLWDLCPQLLCNYLGFLLLVICVVWGIVLPHPDLSGALLCYCPSYRLSEAETWGRNLHQKHQHCVCLACWHFKNSYNWTR